VNDEFGVMILKLFCVGSLKKKQNKKNTRCRDVEESKRVKEMEKMKKGLRVVSFSRKLQKRGGRVETKLQSTSN